MNPQPLQNPDRRRLLAMTGGALGILAFGKIALAADTLASYPEKAFGAKKGDAVINEVFNGLTATPSGKVKLTAPEIAANGAVVPVTVESTLPNVTRIVFFVADNPFPLAAEFVIPPGTEPYISNRIKMAKTSDVVAYVESDGKLYSATRKIKVTVGGCGG